jgi:nucleoside-diphosphate kinase
MAVERTLSILKPDAYARGCLGEVLRRFEAAGLKVVAIKSMWLTTSQAEAFYGVHRERPFFRDLVTFMTSGPIVVQVLEGRDAIATNRQLMGATDPKKADAGTIRADFGANIEANAVHGSDSAQTAAEEVAFFFSQSELTALVPATAGSA